MPKAIDLTPKKVATFGRLIEAVSTPSAEVANGDADPLRQIGNAAFRGLLARMEQGEWLMPASTTTNGTQASLKEVVETVDKLDELRNRGEDRLARRVREAEERADRLEKELARAKEGEVGTMGAVIQAFTGALTAMQQQTLTILQNQYNQTLQLINELRQSQGGDPSGEWLARIGREAIEKALTRDPLSDYEKVAQALDRVLEKRGARNGLPGPVDPQTIVAYLSYDLERFKAQLQHELQREGIQRSKEISEQIAEYLGRAARERDERNDAASDGRSASAPAREPEVFTYRCGACGEEFILRRYATQVLCPHCGTRLMVQTGGNGHNAQARGVKALADTAAQPPSGALAEGDGTEGAGAAGEP